VVSFVHFAFAIELFWPLSLSFLPLQLKIDLFCLDTRGATRINISFGSMVISSGVHANPVTLETLHIGAIVHCQGRD